MLKSYWAQHLDKCSFVAFSNTVPYNLSTQHHVNLVQDIIRKDFKNTQNMWYYAIHAWADYDCFKLG